ncbi:MAG: DUF1428 domain-containing protein [Nanoarchaeota archaeon]
MTYVDGFVLPVPKKNVKKYIKMAKFGGKLWKEHGAIGYKECVGDDLHMKGILPFPRQIRSKSNETVFFSFITYKSRAHRDKVNAKVMKDPRCATMPSLMPFDMKRMAAGGFKVVVDPFKRK